MTFAALKNAKRFAAASLVAAVAAITPTAEAGGCSGGGRPAYPTARPVHHPVHRPVHNNHHVQHVVVKKTCSLPAPAVVHVHEVTPPPPVHVAPEPCHVPVEPISIISGQPVTLNVPAASVTSANLVFGALQLPMQVLDGNSLSVVLSVPAMPIEAPVDSKIRLRLGNRFEYVPVTIFGAVEEPAIPTVHAGEEVEFPLTELGNRIGRATLRVSGLSLRAEVLAWSPAGIALRMPALPLTEAIDAELEITLADGTSYGTQPVIYAPSPNQSIATR